MSSNPYARQLGASAREQKRANDATTTITDLYTFDPSATANHLIQATITANAAHQHTGGMSTSGSNNNAHVYGYDGFMPPPTGRLLASQQQQQQQVTQGGGVGNIGSSGGGGANGSSGGELNVPRPM